MFVLGGFRGHCFATHTDNMDADSKMLSNSSSKNVLKIAGTKPKLLGDENITIPYLLRRETMMRKSKAAIISVAAFATVARRIAGVAQSFSASPYGTGNVLLFAYQPIAPQKDKIGVRQSDRYGYAMVPQARSDRATRR